MSSHTRIYWLHALTPLHVGVGRGVGFIDLPIMREKVTQWPLIPGSTIKGVIKDRIEDKGTTEQKSLLIPAFGRADQDGESANSGSLVFTDARLVCLPVRSLYGTFAWVTSPMVLHRLTRDFDPVSRAGLPTLRGNSTEVLLPQEMQSVLKDSSSRVYFEDLDFNIQESAEVKTWAQKIAGWIFPEAPLWQTEFVKRFAVVPNDSFDFLCETGTEVRARVRIQTEKKAVAKGALWYEESLPAETILAGLVWCDRVFSGNGATPESLLGQFCSGVLDLQIGGVDLQIILI